MNDFRFLYSNCWLTLFWYIFFGTLIRHRCFNCLFLSNISLFSLLFTTCVFNCNIKRLSFNFHVFFTWNLRFLWLIQINCIFDFFFDYLSIIFYLFIYFIFYLIIYLMGASALFSQLTPCKFSIKKLAGNSVVRS